ncbi:cold shock domain-containing protein [Streptomyces sp. NBC_00435]|uniref:cold shock domain-containing protein n=1 Tax=Streptomyces sp. NBC_00435 TaxID=2903649 RepID=UPI002E1C28DE
MNERLIGFVEWYDRATGCGSVVPLGSTIPIRVHRADIAGECKSLSAGQQVSFVIELGPTGFEARHVLP